MIGRLRALALACWVVGCSGHHGLPPAMEGQRTILEAGLARRAPARVHGKLSVKVRSDALGLAGSTGGALFLDRPGRGHLAVFGPLGGPLVTAQTEGTGLAVAFVSDRRHLVSADAAEILGRVTGDRLTLDQLLGLLEGELPFVESDVSDARLLEDGDLELDLRVRGARVRVVLDDRGGLPLRVALLDKGDGELFSVDYGPFEPLEGGTALLPTTVDVNVPLLGLDLDLKFRAWDAPDEVPEVFGLGPPDGYTTEPLSHLFPGGAP